MMDAHGSGTFPDPPTVADTHRSDGPHRSEADPALVGAVEAEVPDDVSTSDYHDAYDATDAADDGAETLSSQVEQPAKVMRIGTMIKQLLEEVRAAPLDEAGRRRLAEIHAASIRELESGLAPELREELDRLTLPLDNDEDHVPSEAELRVAQAQLVGWLEGLFHGIQTALFAQQMAARQQLEEMRRRALPGGTGTGQGSQQAFVVGPGGQILGPAPSGGFSGSRPEEGHGTGQYL